MKVSGATMATPFERCEKPQIPTAPLPIINDPLDTPFSYSLPPNSDNALALGFDLSPTSIPCHLHHAILHRLLHATPRILHHVSNIPCTLRYAVPHIYHPITQGPDVIREDDMFGEVRIRLMVIYMSRVDRGDLRNWISQCIEELSESLRHKVPHRDGI